MQKIKQKDWTDITIGQYQELMTIQNSTDLGSFIEAIAICDDIDPQDIRQMSIAEFNQLKESRSFLLTIPGNDFKRIIEIDGVEYGIEPELNLISTGVFIDCEQFKRDTNANLHNLVALVYRPVIEKNGEDYKIKAHEAQGFEKRANLFKNKVSIEAVFGAILFFSLASMTSLHHTLAYLTQDLLKEVKMMTEEGQMILKQYQEESGK